MGRRYSVARAATERHLCHTRPGIHLGNPPDVPCEIALISNESATSPTPPFPPESRYPIENPSALIGNVRMRCPVAANTALHTAGANGGRPGSPRPLGG